MKVKEFLGRAYYDTDGQMIFGEQASGHSQLVGNFEISVRGWGAIQHLFKDQKEAMRFQDQLGQFIADAINEKPDLSPIESTEQTIKSTFDIETFLFNTYEVFNGDAYIKSSNVRIAMNQMKDEKPDLAPIESPEQSEPSKEYKTAWLARRLRNNSKLLNGKLRPQIEQVQENLIEIADKLEEEKLFTSSEVREHIRVAMTAANQLLDNYSYMDIEGMNKEIDQYLKENGF